MIRCSSTGPLAYSAAKLGGVTSLTRRRRTRCTCLLDNELTARLALARRENPFHALAVVLDVLARELGKFAAAPRPRADAHADRDPQGSFGPLEQGLLQRGRDVRDPAGRPVNLVAFDRIGGNKLREGWLPRFRDRGGRCHPGRPAGPACRRPPQTNPALGGKTTPCDDCPSCVPVFASRPLEQPYTPPGRLVTMTVPLAAKGFGKGKKMVMSLGHSTTAKADVLGRKTRENDPIICQNNLPSRIWYS